MDINKTNQACHLCNCNTSIKFHQDKFRNYQRCTLCKLIFVPEEFFLSESAEKKEYDFHINSPDDQGYRKFLSRLFVPMQKLLPPSSNGLDFGSGPGPTLSVMFKEAGHDMSIYDKFYACTPELLKKKYDFITATEVVEHLHSPGETLKIIWQCLMPGGPLGIMTKLARDEKSFSSWHYKNDLTHVAFFSRETFIWLAETWQAELTFFGNDVIILKKNRYPNKRFSYTSHSSQAENAMRILTTQIKQNISTYANAAYDKHLFTLKYINEFDKYH